MENASEWTAAPQGRVALPEITKKAGGLTPAFRISRVEEETQP